jgi:Cupredoxin-like domain
MRSEHFLSALRLLAIPAALLLFAASAGADDVMHLTIKDHRFQPERLEVPAGVKFKLMVKNEDSTPEEFESFQLNREKVVPPGQEIPVFLGPLDKGEYPFFGDFHQDTAKGVLIAK